MYEPRLDPAAWNKHFQDRKSLRFSVTHSRNQDLFAENLDQEMRKPQRRTGASVKPRLTQMMKKYSASNSDADPRQLIRKYQKAKTTLLPTINRKYPTQYYTNMKVDDNNDYSKYTTASSFRNANKTAASNAQPTLAPSTRSRFGNKLFDAQSIKISPKLTSIRDHEKVSEVEKKRNHDTLGRMAFLCAMLSLFICPVVYMLNN